MPCTRRARTKRTAAACSSRSGGGRSTAPGKSAVGIMNAPWRLATLRRQPRLRSVPRPESRSSLRRASRKTTVVEARNGGVDLAVIQPLHDAHAVAQSTLGRRFGWVIRASPASSARFSSARPCTGQLLSHSKTSACPCRFTTGSQVQPWAMASGLPGVCSGAGMCGETGD
jgi:hypothetical protein